MSAGYLMCQSTHNFKTKCKKEAKMCCMLSSLEKFTLIVTNIIFTVFGVVLVCAGVASLTTLLEISEIIPININAIPISIIVLGSVVFAMAFCGFCGAIKETKWLLFIYSVCMIALAAGKIYLATEIFSWMPNIRHAVKRWVTGAFEANNESFHLLEVAFQCCGTTGSASYNGTLPLSCCSDLPEETTQCLIQDAISDGCVDRLGSYFRMFGVIIGTVLVLIIFFEVVAAVVGLYVCCSPKYNERKKSIQSDIIFEHRREINTARHA